jgi:TetR/AcrR family tetracycline transcriptional repressor
VNPNCRRKRYEPLLDGEVPAVIAALGESGLSSRDAAWAADTLTYYVVGHTIEEQLAAALPGSGHDATARLTGAVDPQRHPHRYAALAHIPVPHHQEHFDYGLHRLTGRLAVASPSL